MFLKVLKMWKSENQNSKLPRKENSVSIVMNLASDWSIESLFEIYSFKNASTHSYLGCPRYSRTSKYNEMIHPRIPLKMK